MLNHNQLLAAKAPFGHNLIIASAGTGKTSTIVGRIAHLLQSGKEAKEILLLTFTNKASGEMIGRIAKLFGTSIAGGITAGTFHAISYKWLRAIGENIVLKRPSELKTLFKTVYDKHISKEGLLDKRILSAQYVYDYHALWENRADMDFALWLCEKNGDHKHYAALYGTMFNEFTALKKELGFVGFNDLLIQMRASLQNGLKSPFFEVLVDEYQDTNPLQNSIIEAINPPSLFCVGDYDQSIYAFNGAEIEIIAGFDKRYPDAKVWTLNKNYRSSGQILSLANRVISHNKRIYPKEMEVVKTKAAAHPRVLAFDELFDQYRQIAECISHSHFDRSEIAVLFRNNSSADGIEAMLKERRIATKRKGSGSFFESEEVRTLLNLLTFLVNPRDLLAFIHVLEFAPKIGASSAKELYDAALTLGNGSLVNAFIAPISTVKPIFGKRNGSLFAGGATGGKRFDDLPEPFETHPFLMHPQMNGDGAKYLSRLWQLLCDLDVSQPPRRQLEIIIRSSLFDTISSTLARRRASKKEKMPEEYLIDQAKMRILMKAETLKELSKPYQESEKFLNAMVLGSSEMSEGSGVNLLSVHASKGLEFDEVFVIDLMDGRFPNRKLMRQAGNIEEERRLFYVAVTRARESLFLSYALMDRYKNISYAPSQFLYEARLVER
jgi:DNA helicase-2/ATP-dependent DNA helicase PcrA